MSRQYFLIYIFNEVLPDAISYSMNDVAKTLPAMDSMESIQGQWRVVDINRGHSLGLMETIMTLLEEKCFLKFLNTQTQLGSLNSSE